MHKAEKKSFDVVFWLTGNVLPTNSLRLIDVSQNILKYSMLVPKPKQNKKAKKKQNHYHQKRFYVP